MLVLIHLAVVGWLTLRPLSVPWVYDANLEPLATIRRDLRGDPQAAMGEIGRRLLLLAPLGVLLPMIPAKLNVSPLGSLTRTVFVGAAVSFTIECLQTAVPGQVVNVDDLLLNTLGVLVAHVAVVPAARARIRRRRGAAKDLGARPTAEARPFAADTADMLAGAHSIGVRPRQG